MGLSSESAGWQGAGGCICVTGLLGPRLVLFQMDSRDDCCYAHEQAVHLCAQDAGCVICVTGICDQDGLLFQVVQTWCCARINKAACGLQTVYVSTARGLCIEWYTSTC
jgi:hypothetical protein